METEKNQKSNKELTEKLKNLTATEISQIPYYYLWQKGVITYAEFLVEAVEYFREKENE